MGISIFGFKFTNLSSCVTYFSHLNTLLAKNICKICTNVNTTEVNLVSCNTVLFALI